MKKLLLSVATLALIAAPTASFAQTVIVDGNASADEDAGAVIGGTAGGTTGAIVGGLVFGPIGAVIGGFTGATLGASATVSDSDIEYVRLNPTEPVILEGTIAEGYAVPDGIVLNPIEGNATYGYFYTNDRVYFVDLSNRAVVYSPGVVVAAQ